MHSARVDQFPLSPKLVNRPTSLFQTPFDHIHFHSCHLSNVYSPKWWISSLFTLSNTFWPRPHSLIWSYLIFDKWWVPLRRSYQFPLSPKVVNRSTSFDHFHFHSYDFHWKKPFFQLPYAFQNHLTTFTFTHMYDFHWEAILINFLSSRRWWIGQLHLTTFTFTHMTFTEKPFTKLFLLTLPQELEKGDEIASPGDNTPTKRLGVKRLPSGGDEAKIEEG